ncbi:hypothetical protein CSPHI_10965 [Corynebacterium sphenisci DSM 44792]|uniref:DUF3263 domain-containing protein n=1 Tax=Corynebacterium sphenisci DSM 44792 TaxID=1437874 RepID=A0A1L7CZV2_9CORY|nr:DUF3263 domain-containing protein [Corynebacterium sphenisci]APT91415.1 hypothetical protein CSPHI_10965 [Corynebacterium sphenisci DSM 44792]
MEPRRDPAAGPGPAAGEPGGAADPGAAAPALAGDTGGVDPALAWRMLRFERRWVTSRRTAALGPAAREEAVRAEFGMAPLRYHQLLNRLISSPGAEAADPVTVHRLQRLRDGAG